MSKPIKLTPALVKRIIQEEKLKIQIEKNNKIKEEKKNLFEAVQLYKRIKNSSDDPNKAKALRVLKNYIKRRI